MNPPPTPDAPPTFDGRRPFDELTPERTLDLLDAAGLRPGGSLLQLNSFENRVVQAGLDDGRVVVAKFYRPGRWSDAQVLEEHGFALELAEDEVPLAAPWTLTLERPTPGQKLLGSPPTLLIDGRQRMAVAARCGGRHPDRELPGVLQRIGHFLGRLHRCGERQAFQHRLDGRGHAPARRAIDWLVTHHEVSTEWRQAAEAALAQARLAFEAAGELKAMRIHGDMHPGNLLWTDAGPHFVDLDDACTGWAVQDLWMLLDADRDTMREQLFELLDGYEVFREFDWREWKLIEALRTVRMLHHSAWLAQRAEDPAFQQAFPWFGGEAYWRHECIQLQEQQDRMSEWSSE